MASKFDGTIRRLGAVPGQLLTPVIDVVRRPRLPWTIGEGKLSIPLEGWQVLILLLPAEATVVTRERWSARAAQQRLESAISPIIAVAAGFLPDGPFDTQKCVISKLDAGMNIPTHVDSNPTSDAARKIHVPLVTHPDVRFTVGGEEHHLEVGGAYEINNGLPHSVVNPSQVDRVHLIFELRRQAVAVR